MELTSSFWAGRRVLLTGHTGFKGGWLSLWLSGMGARVFGLALDPPTQPSLFETAGVAAGMAADLRVDLRDAPALSAALDAAAPEVVIHLAAQSLLLYSYREPVETFAVNVMGTVHLLQASLQCPSVKAVIVATSDKCYQHRGQPRPFRENDPLGGADPYSASKACAELATAAYRSSFCAADGRAKAIATVRAGNVIGGGDWGEGRLIPDCIRSLVDDSEIVLRYPDAVRPWQHVFDALSGYLCLAQGLLGDDPDRYAEPWNFGPDADGSLPVSQIVERIAALWGSRSLPVRLASVPQAESPVLRLDSTKADMILGWRPRWQVETALAETVAWYRAWHRGEDMRAFSLAQIECYLGEGA
jgi:CDP-glucose 4,6-dehydratase